MESILTSLTNPQWSNAEHTMIDCNISTTQFGNLILPFTASQNDIEPHGCAIFADIVSGKYGLIADYIARPTSETAVQLTVAGAQTL